MAGESILAIEDAILALLLPLKLSSEVPTSYLKVLATYAGDFQEAVEHIVVTPPACLVIYAQSDHVIDTEDEFQQWTVLVADSALRGDATGRRGGGTNSGVVGTYTMLEDVKRCLDGVRPLPDVGPLLWRGNRVVAATKAWSIYAAHYQARITYTR
jgi:phage gp37-like protein